jgi:hypothetical protein
MDESLQELENELKNLRPHRPSPALQARVAAALAESPAAFPSPSSSAPEPVRSRAWFSWPLAAAAALAVTAGVALWRSPSAQIQPQELAQAQAVRPGESAPLAIPAGTNPAPVNRYRPVGAASVLYDLKDDGDVYLSDDTPVRRLRYRYVDTYTWKNPATNASLKWSVPREEIRVLPASLH